MTREEKTRPGQSDAENLKVSPQAPQPAERQEPAELADDMREKSARVLLHAGPREEFPPEYRANAERVVTEFLELQPGERVLFITDQNEHNTDPRLIALLQEAMEKKGGTSTVFRIEGQKERHIQTPELQQLIAAHDVIWIASDVSDETLPVGFDAILEKLDATTGKRMAHCTGVQVDLLSNDGALSEPKEMMEQRMDAIEKRVEHVAGFHITTAFGTDLWMSLKPGRTWYKASGRIPRGSWDNLPGGEIFTTPDQEHVNGTLVLSTLHDDVTPEQGVDQPVELQIKDGKIVQIEGGTSAEKLRTYLQENSQMADDPEDVYTCAEIAFGVNTKATALETHIGDFDWQKEGPSAVITEKRLGTVHVAFGSDNHGYITGKPGDARGKNRAKNIPTHLDFVLAQEGLTVRAFHSLEAFERAKAAGSSAEGSESLIENGDFRLFADN
ncbi:MAG: aminopeptidase [Candidatus Peregrinibacteria bacterium]